MHPCPPPLHDLSVHLRQLERIMGRFGWIGVGVMGHHMAGHLLSAGHEARVFSRTLAKCQPLVERGAVLAASPREAAEGADAVFTMVGTPADVESVIRGDGGVLAGLAPGAVLIDLTTSTPGLAVQLAAWSEARGALALDAPVSGGDAVDHVRRQRCGHGGGAAVA